VHVRVGVGVGAAASASAAPPAGSALWRCPLACFGCQFTHSQLQRWADHANTHKADFDDGGALWAELVLGACEEAKLQVDLCACGAFYPSTQHGRRKHLTVCAVASAEDAAASSLGGAHASAYSGAFAGITTQGFGADVRESEVAIGALRLAAVERGATAGDHQLATSDPRTSARKTCVMMPAKAPL
jgi:hypothetical protein